jgi:hypothetical protein
MFYVSICAISDRSLEVASLEQMCAATASSTYIVGAIVMLCCGTFIVSMCP